MRLISVIVAVYNSAPYLYQCVNSILTQSYTNLEIILVNDGSTDESFYFCEYFKKIDKRIKVIHKKNAGLVSSRKSGLLSATGEYVCYVDGDDWLSCDYISSYVSYIDKDAVDVVIASHYKEFVGSFQRLDNNITYGYYNKEEMIKKVYPYMLSDASFFCHGIFTYSWGKLYKKSFAMRFQLDIPDSIFMGEDAAFLYPLLFEVDSIAIIDYCGYIYRQRGNSILKVFDSNYKELDNLITLFCYLKKRLASYDPICGILRQIDEYFFVSAISRTGLFLNDVEKLNYFELLKDIPRGSKICLYNSGSFGQRVFSNIQNTNYFKMVAWADRDYNESKVMGLPVIDPRKITDLFFDFIFVATIDLNYYNEIAALLGSYEIPKNKIKMVNLQRQDVSKFVEYLLVSHNKGSDDGL